MTARRENEILRFAQNDGVEGARMTVLRGDRLSF
jgi:hypothetical protein